MSHSGLDPRVLSLVPRGRTGCYLWRTVWPSHALRRHGYVADYCWFDEFRDGYEERLLAGEYNVVVTPRLCFLEDWMTARWQYTMDKSHAAWVYEVDDDLFSEPIEERFFNYSEARKIAEDMDAEERSIRLHHIAARERRVRSATVGICDAVTVSTEALARVVRPLTQAAVHVAPNAIDDVWFRDHLKLDQEPLVPQFTIGWAGGWRPSDDTEVLAAAWHEIARRYPNVGFVLIGWTPPEILASIPSSRLTTFEWQDLDDYPVYLRNIDIACCSVANNTFNGSKTPIKWFESTLAGSACVGSHTLYGDVITDEYNGLLATTVDEWTDKIARLIDNDIFRTRLSANARRSVADLHGIETAWPAWVAAFQDALDRSPRTKGVTV